MSELEGKAAEETLGAYLKRIRESKGLSLEEFAQKTRISETHLQEIEAGEWNKFPVEAYVRGYLNSIAVALDLDMPKILECYSKEVGSSYSQEFVAQETLSSDSDSFAGGKFGGGKSSVKTIIIVVLILAVVFFAGMNFLKKMEQPAAPAPVNPTPAVVEDDTSSFEATVPDGAENVPPESLTVSAPVENDSAAIKAPVKSNSATTFVTSSDSKKDSVAEVVETGKIRIAISGNDSATSWVGLYRSLNDNKVLKEANITSSKSAIRYTYNDTLCVVIGNSDAVGQMTVNGKVTKVPVRKGYASRFCLTTNGKFTRR